MAKKNGCLKHVQRIRNLAEEKNGAGMEKWGHIASIMGTAQQQRGEKSNYRYFCVGNHGDADDHRKE